MTKSVASSPVVQRLDFYAENQIFLGQSMVWLVFISNIAKIYMRNISAPCVELFFEEQGI